MYHISSDRREQNSADKLAKAAEQLLLRGETQKWTVSLLSKEAGVSRSTFYRLFDEPDDVLQYAADREFDTMVRGYLDLMERAKAHDLSVPPPARWYAEAFRKRSKEIAAMVNAGKSETLTRAHRNALRKYAPVLFPDLEQDSEEYEFFLEMRTSILMGTVRAWVATGQNVSVDAISRYADQQLKYLTEV